MGKAYSDAQKVRVRALLESGRDEDSIEKETGVSDRTIRRWKLDLERTGRIGKPPESRTGRHRVLSVEVEAALFDHVKANPGMSVDDMLWWLYDQHKIVVGTRTIRRAFERKGGKLKHDHVDSRGVHDPAMTDKTVHDLDIAGSPSQSRGMYPPHFAPMVAQTAEQQLAQALQQQQQQHQDQAQMQLHQSQPHVLTPQQHHHNQHQHLHHHQTTTQQSYAAAAVAAVQPSPAEVELLEDEETLQLQLQQIALQKQELELRLKMKRLQQGRSTPATPTTGSAPSGPPSSLYNPIVAATPTPPKRDSRSKKKIAESKKRTAERQERMLRELERRSRRRDHLTTEWVTSKDIWPLRAQGLLADLMHQYSCYTYSQAAHEVFEAMYRQLYQLVDLSRGDWDGSVHDDLLRERMKRKMSQLRTKMQKTGEIVGRGDATFGGWHKADDYTGEQAGAALADESELADALQAAPPPSGSSLMADEANMAYDPVPDHQAMAHAAMPYATSIMQHASGAPQYPMLPPQHHTAMLPYGPMDGAQQGPPHQENLVL